MVVSQGLNIPSLKMLDGTSSALAHRLQNLALVLLSIVFLPLNTSILFTSYIWKFTVHNGVQDRRFSRLQRQGFVPRTVLVTGVGMTKGLALARLFYEAGHTVIGADFEPNGAHVCGRVSTSLKKFYPLQKPTLHGSSKYVLGLLDIIAKEKVDLWVSCSGVASAVDDGEAKEAVESKTSCKAIQFDVKTTQILHEKDTFIERTAAIGLAIPETRTVRSRTEVEEFLDIAPAGRRYIMKTIGVDDSVRADMTLLPRPTKQETSEYIARRKISAKTPWIIQQFVQGSEFCTHSLVIKGQVKAFVACPSAELLMHYEALPSTSALSQAMFRFTDHFAKSGGESFTGHLSFDFMVEEEPVNDPGKLVLYPIECNPRAHTAVALFNGTSALADAYLSLLNEKGTSKNWKDVVIPSQTAKYYWSGHDIVAGLILPSMSFAMMQISLTDLVDNYRIVLTHLLTWRDGTYELWDPLPWWWLYHIYWPMKFLSCIWTGSKWSRMNVSTTKMFEC